MRFKEQVRKELALIRQDLNTHMKRTDMLEGRLEAFWPKALTALSIISGVIVLVHEVMK